MAEICRGAVSDSEASTPCEGSSRAARRRRMEIRRFKIVTPVAASSPEVEDGAKRQKLEAVYTASAAAPTFSRQCENALENSVPEDVDERKKQKLVAGVENGKSEKSLKISLNPSILAPLMDVELYPKFGVASVCGRRRDMEDAVAAHPSFCGRGKLEATSQLHFFGVYDGHGCSHVAMRCRDRLHELVKEELAGLPTAAIEWKRAMERSFWRMDKEVVGWNDNVVGPNCRCEMQSPDCDAVGSTAVVAVVTLDKIIVANCGDSRAVLCRNGKSVPLSSDHKPDRPDELNRIEAAGGRVIFWDGPRVLGVLAMSRAIGDNYLKPYVTCEPEVTITDRTAEDDCLILASDGLWDVVSNDTACGVARMCLRGKAKAAPLCYPPHNEVVETSSGGSGGCGGGGAGMYDKACSDASMLLTKLSLARHSTDNVSVVVVDLRRDT